MKRAKVVVVVIVVLCVGRLWRVGAQQPLPDPVATFSILGYDPATGEIGGAVQSRVFSVGNGVLWAEAGVGVVATQAIVDVSYGPKGLALLRAGMSPAADHQGDLGQRSRSAAGGLDQAGAAVRRDRREGQRRGLHRAEGDDLGRRQARQVQSPRRATSSPVRRWSRTWSRRSKRRPGICRCA